MTQSASPITSDILLASRWHQAEPLDTYIAIAERLRALALEAENEAASLEARALRLLADLCEMALDPDSENGPFQPAFVIGGRRSIRPEDLPSEEVLAVALLSEDARVPPLLRARLADVAWLRTTPRDPKYARIAIDAYIATEPTSENWFRGRREELTRAIQLSREQGKDCAERVVQIETVLVEVVLREPPVSEVFVNSVAELLAQNRLALSRRAEIAVRLETAAENVEHRSHWPNAVTLYLAAANWFARAGEDVASARAMSKAAEMRTREGEFYENSPGSSYLMAGASYETAVQLLRRIPRKHRGPLDVDARLSALRERLRGCNDRSLDEMVPYSGESVDIRDMVETARGSVSGKEPWHALAAFVRIARPPSPSHWREQAKESITQYPLQALFSSSRLASDGRLISRSPGIDLNEPESPGWEEAIHERAVQNLMLYNSLVVQGGILPALDAISLEHHLPESFFVALAARSPVVPRGRERMVGKGLSCGFRREFAVAAHLLAPQVENIVRAHVVALGGETRKLDQSGIETEIGLSALMELPEVERVLGPTMAFELRAIFCDVIGSNLRNNIAHGLLDDQELYSAETVYAWWFCLRLIMLPLLQAAETKNSTESHDEAVEPAEGDVSHGRAAT